nr:G protein-coupled receptor [Proales similis]
MVSRIAKDVGPFTGLMRFVCKDVLLHMCITLGLMGNIITLVVFVQKRLRRTSTALYLSALTTVDVIYIVSSFINSLPTMYPNINLTMINPYLSLVFYPLVDFASNTSVYIILAFTFERYIAVAHPLISIHWCRPSKTKKIIVCVLFFTVCLTFPTLLENKLEFQFDIETNRTIPQLVTTNIYPDFALYKFYYFWFIAITVQIIPLSLLIVFNSILIKHIHYSHLSSANPLNRPTCGTLELGQSREHSKESVSVALISKTGVGNSQANDDSKQMRHGGGKYNKLTHDQTRASIILLATVIVFLLCQLPTAILLVSEAIWPLDDQSDSFKVDIILGLNNIANGLTAINSSVNFILYSCFSKRFRQEFRCLLYSIVTCKRPRNQEFNKASESLRNRPSRKPLKSTRI